MEFLIFSVEFSNAILLIYIKLLPFYVPYITTVNTQRKSALTEEYNTLKTKYSRKMLVPEKQTASEEFVVAQRMTGIEVF
jgi:hypothetical protein